MMGLVSLRESPLLLIDPWMSVRYELCVMTVDLEVDDVK